MRDKPKIEYVCGNETLLDGIRLLWQSLNQYHLDLSPCFKRDYVEMNFKNRKAYWLKKTVGADLRVDIAVDSTTGQNVGYCLSSIDESKTGEIESLSVAFDYRCFGIGDSLMRTVLAWMNEKRTVAKIVEVAAGNERAFSFYNRYGFFTRKTVLKQIAPAKLKSQC
jgi:ribosomal protein S18 acetylase RimI-like enzyme